MTLEKIGSPRKVNIYEFRHKEVHHQKPLFYHHKNLWSIFSRDLGLSFNSTDHFWIEIVVILLIWLLLNIFRGNWTLVALLFAWIQRKSVFLEKKSDKTITELRWKSLEALLWRLSGPNKLAIVSKEILIKKPSNKIFHAIFFSYCYVSGKVDMKFSLYGVEKHCFMAKNFCNPIFFFQFFVSLSVSAVLL